MSRIVVLPNPIFWKSWSDTSRIFFLVASFFDSRRPISPLFGVSESLERYSAQHQRGQPRHYPSRRLPEQHSGADSAQDRRRYREGGGRGQGGLQQDDEHVHTLNLRRGGVKRRRGRVTTTTGGTRPSRRRIPATAAPIPAPSRRTGTAT